MSEPIRRSVPGAAGDIAVYLQGDPSHPAVLMAHSILSSSMMWEAQAALLATRGFYVVRADTRGHGASAAPHGSCTMDDLAADSVTVLDALDIDRAHYVGLSLGGMSGFGLGIHHAERLSSLCLCDCRADAPQAFAAPWDERIAAAEAQGSCSVLAQATIERWFGKPFVENNPMVAERFVQTASATSVTGFTACARAIQQLDYLAGVPGMRVPTTLIVGANDGALPDAMRHLQAQLPGAMFEVIDAAGHLPNIDQLEAFNAALLRHFERVTR